MTYGCIFTEQLFLPGMYNQNDLRKIINIKTLWLNVVDSMNNCSCLGCKIQKIWE